MAIPDAQYVLLTSFKRDGQGVGTPVWIAPLGDGTAGVTTMSNAWKAKRIRRTPRVLVQPCDVRGTPTPGTEPVEAVGAVHEDAATKQRVEAALRAKYRLQYRFITAIQRIAGVIGRRRVEGVVIVLAAPSDDA
ncbi:PPOX class F420-dependent oxidoreductase [Agrococcus sp. SGAir0287]|uniref:PPOX class F420-dependent oxidoreductase n=1 Tax=Agrococcus sp. SGAir0287 TaxID=2070347 RepID=UPI0010CD0534|nr:PPOX class F420-dependent oxidoreductase [Agrococcus sp. SGAir0287]QCR20362.1 PPOX class F420-dependent oxidoreductase [Agrococcus sp. SGAir0287]